MSSWRCRYMYGLVAHCPPSLGGNSLGGVIIHTSGLFFCPLVLTYITHLDRKYSGQYQSPHTSRAPSIEISRN